MATNLQFIKSQELTEGAILFEMTDCFNANYDVYKIIFRGLYVSITNELSSKFRFLDTSNTQISTNYEYAVLKLLSSSGFQEQRSTNATEIQQNFFFGTQGDDTGNCEMTVYNPFDSSSYTFTNSMSSDTVNLDGRKNIGVLKSAETVTGIAIVGLSGYLFGGGTVSVYGVK